MASVTAGGTLQRRDQKKEGSILWILSGNIVSDTIGVSLFKKGDSYVKNKIGGKLIRGGRVNSVRIDLSEWKGLIPKPQWPA
jgi:hypothetical protein